MKKTTSKITLKKKLKNINSGNSIQKKELFIVGMGASAGGLEALKNFFDNVPSNSGMAFIIVQHLDPNHKSLLPELIGQHTKMKVSEIKDGIQVKPNCVYTIPPNNNLKINSGCLHLSKLSERRALRRPIDLFFHSLAVDQKEKAIGIILSGTGSEGSLGLKEIKTMGGKTIVQDPKTALFKSMPQNAISNQTIDYVLAPDSMAKQLIIIAKNPSKLTQIPLSNSPVPTENQLQKIFQLIRTQSGHDFSNYKINTIVRRVTNRITVNHIANIEDYVLFLQNNPSEIENLYKDFLIGVTSFFRDKEVFKTIEKKIIPPLLEKCKEKQECRVWICGCSTGEEAYSLAILFREALEKSKQNIKVTIFASDIDQNAIESARSGLYSENALAGVSPDRITRFFIRKQNKYQLKKEIREMLIFAHHNVIKDSPFSKIDLITCRNLLIYMNSDLQKKIIPIFHFCLNNDGILVLGTSESVGEFNNIFSVLDSKNKIYKKKISNRIPSSKLMFELPNSDKFNDLPKSAPPISTKKVINISSINDKILLNNYAPPSVIIDKNNDVLYFSGNTGIYLDPPMGEPRLNILEMIKPGLKHLLETAIKKARAKKLEIFEQDIEINLNNLYHHIILKIKPIVSREIESGTLMIIFESVEKSIPRKDSKSLERRVKHKSKEFALEKELLITREHLQAAISELEMSNEDIQTTKEEYQTSNEELQSTNEELETSREELQSLNEELITLNTELSSKIEQLSHANDDLNNLLTSIEIAAVFLDRNLKIKRFTPSATKIFNLIPSDIERPVTHLSSNIIYKNLVEDIKNSLKTLAVKTSDTQTTDGTWYHMRILPYRTVENIIEGVLVTFIDITDQKNTEEKLKKTNDHLNLVIENLNTIPFTFETGKEIKISFVGKSCERITGFLPEQFTNKASFWSRRIHPNDRKKIYSAFLTISKKGISELPFRWKCLNGKYKYFINCLRYVKAENGRPDYIVGAWQQFVMKSKQ